MAERRVLKDRFPIDEQLQYMLEEASESVKSEFWKIMFEYNFYGNTIEMSEEAFYIFRIAKINWDKYYPPSVRKGDSEYRKWRIAVYKRDKYICQDCNKKTNMPHAHHIKQWKFYPLLRYDINNGICLCENCHSYRHSKNYIEPINIGEQK